MTEVVYAGFSEIPDSVYQDSRLKDSEFIYGPRGCKIYSYNYLEGKFCSREKISELNEKLNFHFMPPGFTCVIKVKTRSGVKDAVSKINRITSDIRIQNILDSTPESGINHILFRCDPEEKDISKGARGPYGLKEYGQFPYSGLASIFHMLKKTKLSKDMGSEIFDNMRNGDWLLDYCANRIT
jgi:glycogen debranching enzyme